MSAAETIAPRARARALELMESRLAERAQLREAGYLDLLEEDPESTGIAQNLMLTRLVPAIYERWWRPALGRAVKGLTGPGMAEEVRIARLLMGISRGDVVIDVACGPGNFSRAFAETVGPEGLVVGVDASATMLARGGAELVAAGADNLALVRCDVAELPFRDDSFDGLCCFGALHLFADPFGALGEMTRVISPGGRIAIMTSVRRQITHPVAKAIVERTSGMRVFEPDELVTALQVRGFGEIHQRISGVIQFVGGRLEP